MPREARKYLFDVAAAARRVEEFIQGHDLESYLASELVRSATERQLTTIGEALNQLAKLDPSLAERVRDHRRIVALRNILVHAYAEIDSRIVWAVVQRDLPRLLEEVGRLLFVEDLRHRVEEPEQLQTQVRRRLYHYVQLQRSTGRDWLWEQLVGDVLELDTRHGLVEALGRRVRESEPRFRLDSYSSSAQQAAFAARFVSLLRRHLSTLS